ncbi:hypothetical protein J6590_088097 [Homalodisca vitripennis]|nr:hypothetical protein J6590_088096 [Homalodisca vitripennis]KAG8319617.1 hypothetical protein J6590_088097 [Homalodisca vitripennis]
MPEKNNKKNKYMTTHSRLPLTAEEERTRHTTQDRGQRTQDTGHREHDTTQGTGHTTNDTRAPPATLTRLRERVGTEGPLLPTTGSLCIRIVESAVARVLAPYSSGFIYYLGNLISHAEAPCKKTLPPAFSNAS